MSKSYFVGIDSDGTVFDTMRAKHRKAFIPAALATWDLKQIESVFEAYEIFVNLESDARGINRFSGLYLLFQYLEEYVNKKHLSIELPAYRDLEEFLAAGIPLSNQSLSEFTKHHSSIFLNEVLVWSRLADDLFSRESENIAPFSNVKKILENISEVCDIVVVSSASQKGLEHDMTKYELTPFITKIMGQEYGSKKDQLAVCDLKQYKNCIMIGDAPGDRKAAQANEISFYPIIEGKENESWEVFYNEVYPLFLSGSYHGECEDCFLDAFLSALPDVRRICELL